LFSKLCLWPHATFGGGIQPACSPNAHASAIVTRYGEGTKIVMWVIALALSASAQAGTDDLPAPLVRALRARPPSFHCRYEAKPPPNTVILDCTPVCTNPPKIFSVRELVALDASPGKASELSHISAQQYEDWHHHCDRHTS